MSTLKRKPIGKKSTKGIRSLRNQADKLAAEYFHAVHEGCTACGWEGVKGVYKCSGHIEWAHLKSRGIERLRHDPDNCTALCNIHHRYFTQHPDEWKRFIDEKYPGRWDDLNDILLTDKRPLRVVYETWIEHFKEKLRELQ